LHWAIAPVGSLSSPRFDDCWVGVVAFGADSDLVRAGVVFAADFVAGVGAAAGGGVGVAVAAALFLAAVFGSVFGTTSAFFAVFAAVFFAAAVAFESTPP